MKKYFLTILLIVFIVPAAFAHPPTSIEAEYIKAEGKLYVYMEHLSRNHSRHYIKKTVIDINGKEATTEYNRQQIDPNEYAFSTGLKARAGDEITVTAYSSEGGVRSVSITVPPEGNNKEALAKKEGDVKAKVEKYRSNDTSVGVYDSKAKASESKGMNY